MPIYTYRCAEGHTQEEFRLMKDFKHDAVCGRCGQRGVLILSVPNLVGVTKSERMFKNLEMPLGRKFSSSKEVDRFLRETNTVQA